MNVTDDLANYKLQLEQVNVALESEPGNEELMKLKTDLLEVISLEEELIASSTVETAAANTETQGTSDEAAKQKKEIPWKVGEKCMAPASNGQKYLAVIDGFTKENAAITFVGKGTKHMVRTEELSVAKVEAPKKYVWAKSEKGNQHRKTEWQMERERRRARAQKKDQRLKEMELVKEDEKNKWLNFNAKASSRSMKGFKRPIASGSAPDGPAWGISSQTSVSSRRDFGAFKSTQRGNMDSLF